jgi:hypothetical protein
MIAKTATAVALTSILAAGSQSMESCDTTTGRAPARQEDSSSRVEYSATCDADGNVTSYRPHTDAARREAIRVCRVTQNYGQTIVDGLNSRERG